MARVSFNKLENGRYRVRWRNRLGRDGNRTRWAARSRTVDTRAAAIELTARISRELDLHGSYELPERVEAAVVDATLVPQTLPEPLADADPWDPEEAALEYLRERKVNGYTDPSIIRWGASLKSWFDTVREIHGIAEDEALHPDTFSRANITAAKEVWRAAGRSDNTMRTAIGTILDFWYWLYDDPRWDPVPEPPRRTRGLAPRSEAHRAPPAPTMAEIDAVLRRLAGDGRRNVLLRVCLVARFTGLRAASQIYRLRRDDLDDENLLLHVRHGKSRQERRGRTIPVSKRLIDELGPVLKRKPKDSLVRRAGTKNTSSRVSPNYAVLNAAWEEAIDAGEVREDVWSPPGSKMKRPLHAFRAALMAELRRNGVVETTVQRLVGHVSTTAARHYVDDASVMEEMRAAVELLPPVDWEG